MSYVWGVLEFLALAFGALLLSGVPVIIMVFVVVFLKNSNKLEKYAPNDDTSFYNGVAAGSWIVLMLVVLLEKQINQYFFN